MSDYHAHRSKTQQSSPNFPLTFILSVCRDRIHTKWMPRLKIIYIELPIYRKKLHCCLSLCQGGHKGIIAIADSGLADHVGQHIIRVVLLFLEKLI